MEINNSISDKFQNLRTLAVTARSKFNVEVRELSDAVTIIHVSNSVLDYEISMESGWLGAIFEVQWKQKKKIVWLCNTDLYSLDDPANAKFIDEIYQQIVTVLKEIIADKIMWKLEKGNLRLFFNDGEGNMLHIRGRFGGRTKPVKEIPPNLDQWKPISQLKDE